MASKCNKFLPNIFNKTKCQHCFAAKEAHSAAALENNKASRKVSKCGYLFVSPGYDFSNPLDRTRRWQRRFFRLYDDGELSYCVDENPDTVPQGTVDMNLCTDVIDAEITTTHPFSLGIITPEKTVYIKGNSKEEVQWWHDILAEFPKALKAIKPRRKQPMLICTNKENGSETKENVVGASEPKQGKFDLKGRIDVPAYATFKGVRSLKHRYDTSYQEGLRKSSSLHDLSSDDKEMRGVLESTRYLSRSGDRLDILSRDNSSLTRNQPLSLPTNTHFTMPRSTWTRTGQPVPAAFLTPRNPSSSLSSISSQSSTNSSFVPRRGSWDDRPGGASGKNATGKLHRERSSSLKDFPSHFSIAREAGDDGTQLSMSADETDSNETDELKMARSSELNASSRAFSLASSTSTGNIEPMSSKYEDLVYMKKGWLIKQAATEKESRKHWFVLAGNSLRYYKDAKAEEANLLDGRIDLSSCHEVSEIPTHRNYGFKIKTGNGEYTLAAMTMGIRNNWMKAIRLCMELHSTVPKWKLGSPTRGGSQISSKSPPRTAVDDLEFKSGAASSSTAAVTGAGGETAFQLVGRRDPYRRDTQKPARRHHSDVNPGNVSKVLSVREFTASLEPAGDPLASSGGSMRSTDSSLASGGNDMTPRASKIPRHRSPSNENLSWQRSSTGSSRDGAPMMKRYVEGSDNLPPTTSTGGDAQGPEHNKQTPKRNITSESTKEEVKREMMRRAKSPSVRVKEKSRAAKTPRLHSPISAVDDNYGYHMGSATASEAGSAVSDGVEDPAYADIQMSEDEYAAQDEDRDEVGSATASDVVGMDGGLVEILETEVESLKDRLEHTQTELDQMHKDNMDLKTRLHKESTQSLDSGYSGRWGQNSNQSDTSSGRWGQNSNQGAEALKRQLKEARDTVQRQRMDIEALKSKLDMSVSKLTGTEKALSEALKDYKQEKDKFLKLSSEWNRRIRTMESQSKDNIHKLERNREALQAKERECRRLEAEVKTNLQRTREQEREILKLKAVEHEYNQLKEKLDDRDQDLANLRSELKEKDHLTKKMKDEYEQQLEEMEREYGQERDDLELHLEELKSELYSAHDRQASMSDNMTSNMADMLKEKDDIIAQLEDKMIEADKKLVDLSEELHVEMGENAELAHTIDVLGNEKIKLGATIEKLENQLMSLKSKVSGFESDNFSLKRQLDELHQENTQLHDGLTHANISKDQGAAAASKGSMECERLKKTIIDLNGQIKDLQVKLESAESVVEKKTERGTSEVSSISSLASDHQQDLLHSILVVDSQLKEVNTMLLDLRQNFDSYIDSLDDGERGHANSLANLVEDIGHKCQDIQDTLRDPVENVLSPSESDLKHVITVSASSNNKEILDEYKGLKVKFDQAVNELRKVKKDLKETYNFHDSLKQEDTRLKEKMDIMEGAYKQEIVELIARVDSLTNKIVNVQTDSAMDTQTASPFSDKSGDVVKEIEGQLSELDSRISSLEQQATNLHQQKQSTEVSMASNSLPDGANGIRLKLEDVRSQLEETNEKLKSLSSSFSSSLATKVESYKERIGSVSSQLSSTTAPAARSDNPSQEDTSVANAGFSTCLLEIKKKVQEIGEQLDSIEENDEDSDSEDEGEQSTVEEIREKLSSLTEYIEQHSKMSTSDWTLLRLMSFQKDNLKIMTDRKEDMEASISSEDKLKIYSDRLSLEAVLLSEMAHILQTKDYLTPEDAVSKEIECLNSQVLQLHQKLDNEMKTMHFESPQADVLMSYAELMAEKILVNGQLFHGTLDRKSHQDSNTQPSIQPVLLATEALLRSQIDSFISSNMDKTSDEILSLPTHLTARTIVQGEFTFALSQLKSRLQQCPEALQPGPTNYQFMFDRLQARQERVLTSLECYEKQLVHSLAVIIFKESEEMTIVQGPESVLESLCSDLSTILETHIQHFKERCRTASDTHSAHKYDIIVNELRSCRELVLSEMKSQHEAYARDPKSIRDSSLDIPVQSLDNTIANFGEILSLKAIVRATSNFLTELLKMGSAVLSDLELDQDSSSEAGISIEKGLTSFVNALSEALQTEAVSKETISRQIVCDSSKSSDTVEDASEETVNPAEVILRVPDLSHYPDHLSGRAETIVREAVFSAQLTFSIFKQKLFHDREMHQVKARRPVRVRPQLNTEESNDSDDTLDLQTDFQAYLVPLEEVLENKHEDELEALQVVLGLVSQIKESWTEGGAPDKAVVEDQLRQLEQKLQHELEVAQQRHDTHLEVFKQESSKLEKTLEEQQQDRDHYEDRCCQLEDELMAMQLQHEEDKDRVKQDILTAVHAIRSNDEKSEMSLIEKSSKLTKELAMQKLNFRKVLTSIKKEVNSKEKSAVCQTIEEHIKSISLSDEEEGCTFDSHEHEEQGQESQPPLPSQPPPDEPDGAASTLEEVVPEASEKPPKSQHQHQVELLKKEKEAALAEEMRNTKAALEAVKSAYEDELAREKEKYKEMLVTMYTEEYINEIRRRHQEEEERMSEELQKLNMHYSSKFEDYKLLEMKLQQTKQEYESHINQLIASNNHLEEMLNREIDSLKDFIKNKPSSASLTTGSATMEEELYDAKIMVRVKDAELQKLRSQVKNLENSLHRTTEEQRQTMTQYMQSLKTSGETKKQLQEEVAQLTEKLNKVLGSQGLKANIRRTPSFHQRARSPSPESSPTPRKETDHSSRDSHRRRHIHPKDLRRSKSSPSLPYVFDGKGSPSKLASAKASRRSRSPKT